MRMHKGRSGHFERVNLRREKAITARRREMINAAMAGGQSGFAVQIRMGSRFSDAATGTVGLREARPRTR